MSQRVHMPETQPLWRALSKVSTLLLDTYMHPVVRGIKTIGGIASMHSWRCFPTQSSTRFGWAFDSAHSSGVQLSEPRQTLPLSRRPRHKSEVGSRHGEGDVHHHGQSFVCRKSSVKKNICKTSGCPSRRYNDVSRSHRTVMRPELHSPGL